MTEVDYVQEDIFVNIDWLYGRPELLVLVIFEAVMSHFPLKKSI